MAGLVKSGSGNWREEGKDGRREKILVVLIYWLVCWVKGTVGLEGTKFGEGEDEK